MIDLSLKVKDLRSMSVEELNKKLDELKKVLISEGSSLSIRKSIARIKTILSQKKKK